MSRQRFRAFASSGSVARERSTTTSAARSGRRCGSGFAVGRHLRRHGRGYDIVHTAAFPYFPLLAAGILRRRRGYELLVDWYEVWTRSYWQRYAGRLVGSIGWLVQRRCTRVRQHAFCISRLTERRLLEEGYRGQVDVLPGLYDGPFEPAPHVDVEPVVVFAGRQIPEKRIPLLVEGFAVARRSLPKLRLDLFGDGPDRPAIERTVAKLGLEEAVALHGRRPREDLEAAMARAACLATASEREGYGLIVVEAAAREPRASWLRGGDAAVELVEDGVNGVIAADASPESVGAAITRVVEAGPELRAATGAWFAKNVGTLTAERSLELVLERYAGAG